MRISVVVPTWRRPDLLERCLAALAAQDFDPAQYEVLVCDDGDEARIRAQVERWAAGTNGAPRVRYLPVRDTQGPAGARNLGWRHARGEVIAFTDDDTIPRRDWLTEGWKAMGEAVAAATGRTVVPLPPRPPTDYERDIRNLETAEFVTANCFVRRAVLEAIGGFDERFTSAWREDSDLQFRLLRQGPLVRAERAVIEHPVRPPDGWSYGIRQHRKIQFDALLYKKHPQLYRMRIRRYPPLDYYAIVLAVPGVVLGTLLAVPGLAWGSLAAWLALTARFVARRLRGTSKAPGHVAEMVATSLAIPFVAVYWRLVGAWRFRVLFL